MGRGAFYSLTPRRDLADLGVKELRETPHIGKDIERYPSKDCSQAEGKSLLLERRCREVTEDLGLNKLKANPPYPPLGKGANKGSFCKGAGAKHLRIFNQDILRPSAEILSANLMTNAQNDMRVNNKPKHVILSKNCGVEEQSKNLGEGSQNKIKSVCSLLGKDLTLTPTPSPIWRGEKKSAFTLAEVLITLGIVGIVAAMTLPMLAENYQRRVVETRLKKFYTTFNQAILRAVEYHGPSESWNYQFSALYNDVQNYKPREIEFAFNYYLRDYLNVVQEQQVFYTNGAESKLYYLSDGSAFLFSPHTNVEVNFFPKNAAKCLRSSDSYGVCQFVFLYNPKMVRNNCGRFYTYHCNKGLEPYMYNWDGTIEALYNGGYGCAKKGGGFYCTALIQHNDWQFPKDYPRKIRY